jgi:hypothetical protein
LVSSAGFNFVLDTGLLAAAKIEEVVMPGCCVEAAEDHDRECNNDLGTDGAGGTKCCS